MPNRARKAKPDTLSPQARRLLSVEGLEAMLARATTGDRLALAWELRHRIWALRYAMRQRARRIEAEILNVEHLELLQAQAIADERSLTLSLRLWAPELAGELEASTGAWQR